VYKQEAQLPQR